MQQRFKKTIMPVVRRLKEKFAVYHSHVNACCDYSNITSETGNQSLFMPRCFELSMINRNKLRKWGIPTAADLVCWPHTAAPQQMSESPGAVPSTSPRVGPRSPAIPTTRPTGRLTTSTTLCAETLRALARSGSTAAADGRSSRKKGTHPSCTTRPWASSRARPHAMANARGKVV